MNRYIHNIILSIGMVISICWLSHVNARNEVMITNVWIGGIGDWHLDTNWSLGHIPSANENIEILNSNDDVLVSGSNVAVGQSLFLKNGILTINTNATLIIDLQFNSFIGMENDSGRINNDGLIEVFGGAGTDAYGIKTTNEGLTINSGSIFIHDIIGNNADGIFNDQESTFDNLGSLLIENISGPGSDGISNDAQFNNMASMNIDTIAGSGIINLANGMFETSGSVSITEIDNIGVETEGGLFINQDGALLSLTGIGNIGIVVRSNSTLVNNTSGLLRIATGNGINHLLVESTGIFDCQGELDVIVN